MFDATILLCAQYHMTPFEMFNQDADEVIMLLNYHIGLAAEKKEIPAQSATAPHHAGAEKVKRIKVNDRTATGGWF